MKNIFAKEQLVYFKADKTKTPYKIIDFNKLKNNYTLEAVFNQNLKKSIQHKYVKKYLIDFFTWEECDQIRNNILNKIYK